MTTSLFRWGEFKLSSGSTSCFKIDTDALEPADWYSIACLVMRMMPPFSKVEGVPRGGLPLARMLRERAYATSAGGLLIVDDVLSTGASMEKKRAGRKAKGFVVFSRAEPPPWVTALFTMEMKP